MDILLIPGFMLDADLWTDMRPGLDALGHAIDADTTRDDTIAGMADRAIAGLSEPTIIIGFSMGGYIAREIAYRAPAKTAGLVLITTSSARHDMVPIPAGAPPFRQLGSAVVSGSLHPEHRTDVAIERIQAMSRRLGSNVFRQQTGMARADDTARLGEITCPSLIIAAAQDRLRSLEESRILHEGISGSSFAIIENSGHMIPIEQPEQLVDLLRDFTSNRIAASV